MEDARALYPSIQQELWMAALQWFTDNHTSFNQALKSLCLKLAHVMLKNYYLVCADLVCTIYHQVAGTAMGTSFSAVCAVIYMIWFGMLLVNNMRFRQYILLYTLFIDDLFLIWTGSGPAAILCDLLHALPTADEEISLDWSG